MDGTEDAPPTLIRRTSAERRAQVFAHHGRNVISALRHSGLRRSGLRRSGLRTQRLAQIPLIGGLVALAGACATPQVGQAAQTQTLYSWGYFGSHGVLGGSNSSPQAITGIPGPIKEIATSNSDTYVLTVAGTVWAFGANQYGELGIGTVAAQPTFLTPVQVDFQAGVKIAQIPSPMPYDTALAIDTNGNAWGWGFNGGSNLCLGSASVVTTPTQLPFTHVSLAAGAGHHASYDSNNALFACGDNQFGQLGTGTTQIAHRPVAVQGLPSGRITAVESSFGSSGVMFASGAYYNWGLNNFSQLGNNSTVNSAFPLLVALPKPVTQVFQGSSSVEDGQTLAVLSDGSIYGWGADNFGQLCDDMATTSVSSPTRITPPAGVTWTTVYSGGKASYALDAKANLWACGNDQQGQLGNGTKDKGPNSVPVDVLAGVTMFSSTQSNQAAVVQH
jgi:alpha-tubulin suppressor-like RCC1 family protein